MTLRVFPAQIRAVELARHTSCGIRSGGTLFETWTLQDKTNMAGADVLHSRRPVAVVRNDRANLLQFFFPREHEANEGDSSVAQATNAPPARPVPQEAVRKFHGKDRPSRMVTNQKPSAGKNGGHFNQVTPHASALEIYKAPPPCLCPHRADWGFHHIRSSNSDRVPQK